MKLFICYSRVDKVKADELVTALEEKGFKVKIDTRDLPYAEKWKAELSSFIQESDTVIWLVSPTSIASNWVQWELGEISSASKRLVPIVIEPISPEDLPLSLGDIQLLPSQGIFDETTHLSLLVSVLYSDHVWLKEYTRLSLRAKHWENNKREDDLLLGGEEIVISKKWRDSQPLKAPVPNALLLQYIVISDQVERKKKRSRFISYSSAGALVMALVTSAVIINSNLENRGLTWSVAYTWLRVKIGTPPLPEMVEVKPGTFQMGYPSNRGDNPDEFEPHNVTIEKPFLISKHEVTFDQYDAFKIATGAKWDSLNHDSGWGRGDRPVINVSWNDTQEYIAWLIDITGSKYRLPTESEWEYSARAGTDTQYWWGNNAHTGEVPANCYCNRGDKPEPGGTLPVGSFSANQYGLHDTAGNVWEWVQDCYKKDYSETPSDGSAREENNCIFRATRGGAWNLEGYSVRSVNRGAYGATKRSNDHGFRVVHEAD